MPDRELIYWDSCVFLSYIDGNPERLPTIEAVLAEVERSKGAKCIVTSTFSKVEVAYATHERAKGQASPEIERQIDALWNDVSIIRLVEFHDIIALRARDLIRTALQLGFSLKASDAVQLATAGWIGAKRVQTYDKKLRKFGVLAQCEIGEPEPEQMPLDLGQPE